MLASNSSKKDRELDRLAWAGNGTPEMANQGVSVDQRARQPLPAAMGAGRRLLLSGDGADDVGDGQDPQTRRSAPGGDLHDGRHVLRFAGNVRVDDPALMGLRFLLETEPLDGF